MPAPLAPTRSAAASSRVAARWPSSAGSGMAVVVAAGLCCVPNATAALQGGYITGTMTSASLTLAAADPTNYRIDLIASRSTTWDVLVQRGRAGGHRNPRLSPRRPRRCPRTRSPWPGARPARVILDLNRNITDLRAYVVAPGGILPIPSSSVAPAAPAWQLMYDIAAGAVVQGSGTAGSTAPLTLLPWSPVVSADQRTSATGSEGRADRDHDGHVTTVTARRTSRSTTSSPGSKASGSVPLLVTFRLRIDATVLDQCVISVPSTSVFGAGGCTRLYRRGSPRRQRRGRTRSPSRSSPPVAR